MKSVEQLWMLTTYPLWFGDGYSARVMGESAAMATEALAVNFLRICPASTWRDPDRARSATELRERGVRVIDLMQPPDRGVDALRTFANSYLERRVAAVCRGLGVKYLHAQGVRAGRLASRVAPSTRVVVDVHGDVEAEAMLVAQGAKNASAATHRVRWAREDTRRALERSDALVSVGPAMSSWLRTRTSRKPICEVPCATDTSRFERVRHTPSPRFRVLYLGGLQSYQPASLVAQSAADIKSAVPYADFTVVTPSAHDSVRQAFAAHGLDVTVAAKPFDRVHEALTDVDLGIVPRVEDQVNIVACPTKIGEYLASGIPVACSPHVGGWAEYLEDRGAGISLAASPNRLAEFARAIMQNRLQVADKCRTLAGVDWSWAKQDGPLLTAHGLEMR